MDVSRAGRRNVTPEPGPSSTPPLRRAVAAGRPLLVDRAGELSAKWRKPVASAAVRVLARPNPESQLRARLDRFYSEMRAPYLVGGREVRVTPHFATLHGLGGTRQIAALAKIRKLVGAEKFQALGPKPARATSTRGSASDVHKTVQAMIEAGGLRAYGSMPAAQAIRRLMWDHDIGLDCRGYAGQAFLYSRGVGELSADKQRFGLDPSQFVMPNPAFRKVGIAQARAGDWVHLAADKQGRDHNVIVRSNTTHKFEGPRLMVSGVQVPRAFAADGWPPGATPSLRVMELDASWGAGSRGDHGGVERQVWIHNEKSGMWGYWRRGELQISAGPYAHALEGVYRPRREP